MADLEIENIQATILWTRPEPYLGTHAMLRIDDAAGGRDLLRRLTPHVSAANDHESHGKTWIAVAISCAGLKALGVSEENLNTFPEAFRDGMAARADRLLDTGPNAPEHWDALFTDSKVHIALSIFSDDEPRWKAAMETAFSELHAVSGVTLLGTQDFGAPIGGKNPFGFKDGISNPAIAGSGIDCLPGQGPAIQPGEFIFGYPCETGALLPMPHPEVLGRNGSFVVLRKYESQLGTFNKFLEDAAPGDPQQQELIAAKMVGRWRSGAPLTMCPAQDDPELGEDKQRNNNFTYKDDQKGRLVPQSSHMRRMNPRDSELPVLTDVNVHRIIRRSTAYGPPYDPTVTPENDQHDRGVFFIFISARALQTVEFLQREWINHGNFAGLSEERDPMVGLQPEGACFTIPKQPVRKRVCGIQTFNILKGGEYLFMPSLPALRWLSDPDGH